MENQNFNSGGTGANLFAGGAQAGQAVAQVGNKEVGGDPLTANNS